MIKKWVCLIKRLSSQKFKPLQDIRSYFKTKPTTCDNDSDVIPESPQMQPKNKVKCW